MPKRNNNANTSHDSFQIIDKKFDELPIEIRPIVKLCFCTLGIIFTELDLNKCKDLDKRRTISNTTVNLSSTTETYNDDLVYTSIPSIPFGAVRILWQELLDIHNADECESIRKKPSPYEPQFAYWTKFISHEERTKFLNAAKEHIHTPFKRGGAKGRGDNGFGRFIQSIFGGDKKIQSNNNDNLKNGQNNDAEAAVNYLKDVLESLGLVKIIHVKPRRLKEKDDDDDDDSDDNNEDEDADQEEMDDWLDQHSVASLSSTGSASTLTSYTKSVKSSSNKNMDNFGWEEKKRRNLIKRIMKGKNLDFIKIDNNVNHRLYAIKIFNSLRSQGGFLITTYKDTEIFLNQIMVSACFRQRERMKGNNNTQLDTIQSERHIMQQQQQQQSKRGLYRRGNSISNVGKSAAKIDDKSLWYSNRITNRKILEIMLDDASRYTIRLLPSHLMRSENVKDASLLLHSHVFTHARLTVLYATECIRRCLHDCEELRLRAYRHAVRDRTFKKIVIQSYLSVKNCLVAEHPIVDNGNDVIGEHSTGEAGKALHKLAYGCSSKNWTDDAIGLYADALKYKKASYGQYHKRVANTLFMIGSIYLNQGLFPEATNVFNEIYIIEEHVYGVDDMKVAKTCKTIGILYSQMGQYDNSAKAYERALKIELSSSGQDCIEVAETFNTLGIVYGITEENKKALYCFQKSLEIIIDLPQPIDMDLASIHINIGNLYGRKEDYDSAIRHYTQALDHEGNRENSARMYHSMGMAYFHKGNLEDALSSFEESLQIRKASYKINDEDIARTLLIMARIQQIQGLHDNSIEAFEEAGTFIRKKFGENDVKNADVLYNIGLVYSKKGDFQKSLEYHKNALEHRSKILGNDHKDVAESLQNIADILFMLNEQDEAMEYYEKALAVRKNIFGSEDTDVAASYNNLGVMYYKKGDDEKSLINFKEALRIRKEALGDERHEKIGDTLHNMGLVYKNQDNYEEAMTHYEGALVIRKDKLGEGHPKTADTLYNIGTLHTNNRDFLKALEYYEAAIRAYKKAGYPDKHPSVSNTFSWIRYCKKQKVRSKLKTVAKMGITKEASTGAKMGTTKKAITGAASQKTSEN